MARKRYLGAWKPRSVDGEYGERGGGGTGRRKPGLERTKTDTPLAEKAQRKGVHQCEEEEELSWGKPKDRKCYLERGMGRAAKTAKTAKADRGTRDDQREEA